MSDPLQICKALGDEQYHRHEFESAIATYSKGISTIASSTQYGIPLLLNRGQCFMQLRQYNECIRDCSTILALEQNSKAFLRRASCYEMTGDFEKGLKDVESAQKLQLNPSLMKTSVSLYSRLSNLQNKDKCVLGDEVRPDSLVTNLQVLRLNFSQEIPRFINLQDDYVAFQICIGNEFGLWDRRFMDSCVSVGVRCMLVPAVEGLELQHLGAVPTLGIDGKASVSLKLSPCSNLLSSMPASVIIKFYLDSPIPAGAPASPSPVYTLPLKVGTLKDSAVDVDASASCIRGIDIGPTVVFGYESPGSLGIGGKLWDSTYVLLEYFAANSDLLQNKECIELGSGTGMAGIGIACLCDIKSLIMTDYEAVCSLIKTNLGLNAEMHFEDRTVSSRLQQRCTVKSHQWGSSLDELPKTVDVVIASDVIYDPAGYIPLLETLRHLLRAEVYCIIAHRSRHPEEHVFFNSLTSYGLRMSSLLLPVDRKQEQLGDIKMFKIEKIM